MLASNPGQTPSFTSQKGQVGLGTTHPHRGRACCLPPASGALFPWKSWSQGISTSVDSGWLGLRGDEPSQMGREPGGWGDRSGCESLLIWAQLSSKGTFWPHLCFLSVSSLNQSMEFLGSGNVIWNMTKEGSVRDQRHQEARPVSQVSAGPTRALKVEGC